MRIERLTACETLVHVERAGSARAGFHAKLQAAGLGTGELTCTDQCELDTTECAQGAMCGNGVAEAANSEQCDGDDLPETDCAAIDAGTGTLGCTASCAVIPQQKRKVAMNKKYFINKSINENNQQN